MRNSLFPDKLHFKAPAVIAAMLVALGFTVLSGWALGLPLLARIVPSWPPMQPMTALAFVLAGFALRSCCTRRRSTLPILIPLAAISIGMLAQYWTGLSLGIDTLLFRSAVLNVQDVSYPGRMAQATALEFLLFCLFLAWPRRTVQQYRWASRVATMGMVIPVLAITGYLLGAAILVRATLVAMAFHSAFGLVLLFVGSLLAQRDRNWLRSLLARSAGTRLARRLLCHLAGWPLLLGILFPLLEPPLGEHRYLVLPIYAITLSAALILVTLRFAKRLDQWESQTRKANLLLKSAQDRLTQVIDTMPGMFWTTTKEGAVDSVSRQWLDYTGTTPESQMGAGFLESIHPDDRDQVGELWREAVATRTPYNAEYRLRRRDGSYRWFKSRGTPAFEPDGSVSRWLGVVLDIEDRKHAEEALRQERSRLQAIIDNSPLLILVKDMESRIVVANQAIFESIRVPPREKLIGHTLFEAFPQDVAEARWMRDLVALDLDAPTKAEETLRHRDGSWHTYLTTRFPVHDIETQQLIGVCAISADITDRKTAETRIKELNQELEYRILERTEELERSNEALLHSNMELQHFAQATAHDLKTPLRSIAGFAQLLQQEVQAASNTERVQEYSSRVIDNTRRLHTLIDNLLTYTRVDALSLPFEQVDLCEVAGEVLASLGILIGERGAEVGYGDLPTISADRRQITQVMHNLIENGIKYNHAKTPKVSISAEFQQDRWLFAVADNGIGIDPKYHERIFEVFRRLHTYGQVAGTGIGLALCRRIVERHGGRIWVESRPGEGSTFYFTLPIRGGSE